MLTKGTDEEGSSKGRGVTRVPQGDVVTRETVWRRDEDGFQRSRVAGCMLAAALTQILTSFGSSVDTLASFHTKSRVKMRELVFSSAHQR